MWQKHRMQAPYAIHEIDLETSIPMLRLGPGEGGAHVLVRLGAHPVGVVWLSRAEHGAEIAPERLEPLIERAAGAQIRTLAASRALRAAAGIPTPAQVPALTIAVCTRGRAELLRRCLAALVDLRDRATAERGAGVDLLVVDNAPPDDETRAAVADFAGVRYVVELVPGLDFARNRALASTDRPWLAFVDDDAVVDRHWLDRFAEGVAATPDAGCFTGPILPLMLDTEAQLRFERAGGFGKGFVKQRYGLEVWGDNDTYPAGAGSFGTGACMVFATTALRDLGGFDEALDTGPPLPGGGDVDMFYRIVRSGRRLVYLPGLFVRHEHRRDMAGLAKQYRSWGLAIMALAEKNDRTDPAMRGRQALVRRKWIKRILRDLGRALTGRGPRPPTLVWPELAGSLAAMTGEYARSEARMAVRRREHAR